LERFAESLASLSRSIIGGGRSKTYDSNSRGGTMIGGRSIGSILFIISDTNIALNKFRKPYKSAEAIILSTYYVSIWLISFSLKYI